MRSAIAAAALLHLFLSTSSCVTAAAEVRIGDTLVLGVDDRASGIEQFLGGLFIALTFSCR